MHEVADTWQRSMFDPPDATYTFFSHCYNEQNKRPKKKRKKEKDRKKEAKEKNRNPKTLISVRKETSSLTARQQSIICY